MQLERESAIQFLYHSQRDLSTRNVVSKHAIHRLRNASFIIFTLGVTVLRFRKAKPMVFRADRVYKRHMAISSHFSFRFIMDVSSGSLSSLYRSVLEEERHALSIVGSAACFGQLLDMN